tara:strand:+ start:67886 stop:69115 length:1230 start_codon:yes stop_codon:yes gene_type:complete
MPEQGWPGDFRIMSINFNNIRELAPISLISVLLFVSCTQLPIEEPLEDSTIDLTINSTTVSNQEPSIDLPAETEIDPPEFESRAIPSVIADMSLVTETELIQESDLPEDTEDSVMAPITLNEPSAEAVSDFMHSREDAARLAEQDLLHQKNVEILCNEIGEKLGSVSVEDCLIQQLEFAGGYSVNERPLARRDFMPRTLSTGKTRILIMGGIHGDEYSSISIMFKWMNLLRESGGNNFTWRFLPTVNPDGLLDGQANRQNASGVDLNRNFPSQDWEESALEYWRNSTGENPRRFPGEVASSEPEVRWIIEQIENFDPEVIVSVHAPYHLLDFDGPSQAPDKIGDLYLHELGVYPGSLGNYAGLDLGIPVVTLELPSAGIMPPNEQIERMWIDILDWLNSRTVLEQRAAL